MIFAGYTFHHSLHQTDSFVGVWMHGQFGLVWTAFGSHCLKNQ
jgi:hypothetical protein